MQIIIKLKAILGYAYVGNRHESRHGVYKPGYGRFLACARKSRTHLAGESPVVEEVASFTT